MWAIKRTQAVHLDDGNQDDTARLTLAEEPMRTISTNHVGFCGCAWLEEADILAVPNDRKVRVCVVMKFNLVRKISLYSLMSSSSDMPVNEITWDDKRYGMPMALRLVRNPSKNYVWMVVACESGDVVCMDALSGVLISTVKAHKEPGTKHHWSDGSHPHA